MIPDINVFHSKVKLRESYIKTHYPELLSSIREKGCDGKSISERIYQFYHDIVTAPICKFCQKNKTKYRSLFVGYAKYCCNTCNANDPERRCAATSTRLNRSKEEKEVTREKTRRTNNILYGGTGMASTMLARKTKQTNKERYGVENASQSQEIKNKIKQTCLSRYGVEYAAQVNEVRDKIKHSCLGRYGGMGAASNIISNKIKSTNLERYGVEHFINTNKIKQTNLEKYGVDNPMKSSIIQAKVKQTNLERYGVEYPMLREESVLKNQESRKTHYIKLHGLIGITENWDWICPCPHPECKKCEERQYIISSQRYYARKQSNIEPCTNLLKVTPSEGTSIEVFVRNILDSCNINYICNDRQILGGKELDIYVPDKKIGIECNGVYWHSRYGSNYHLNKFRLCQDRDIQLLTIWEDWIKTDPEKVSSIIKSKLGIYKKRIYARQCVIKNITPKDCAQFLNKNHLQNSTKTNVRKGLFYEGQLVAVMTFSTPSHISGAQKQKDGWVLSRFCTLLNTQVLGGAAKLLKSFITEYQPDKIISFASNDISSGNLYKTLGFQEAAQTSAYWYINIKNLKRYHRSSFTKSRLKQLGFDTSKTEEEIMRNTGKYYKIYDSGHTKYVLCL